MKEGEFETFSPFVFYRFDNAVFLIELVLFIINLVDFRFIIEDISLFLSFVVKNMKNDIRKNID